MRGAEQFTGNLLENSLAVYLPEQPPPKKENPQPERLRALLFVSNYSTALFAIVFLYHSALSFGYRFSVLKST